MRTPRQRPVPTFSIVIPTRNEGDNLHDTVQAVLAHTPEPFEIVVVDDASEDASVAAVKALNDRRVRVLNGAVHDQAQGVAASRNRGARAARGEWVVFLDAHCYVPADWLAPLLAAFDADDVGMVGPALLNTQDLRMCGFGGTWINPALDMGWLAQSNTLCDVPFQPGGCQMLRRAQFLKLGGFDHKMRGWGSEDLELCIKVWRSGLRVRMQPARPIAHYFRERQPYPVDNFNIVYNKLRMAWLHLEGERLTQTLHHLNAYAETPRALSRLLDDGTPAERARYRNRFKHRLDDVCDRFGLLPCP